MNDDEKVIHIFINTHHQQEKWKQNNNQMVFPLCAAESDTFPAFPFHFSAQVVDVSSLPLNTQARTNRQAELEQALQIRMRRQQSFLLCSQFTGMPLAGFSVAQHIWAQTFIIASCLRALISVLFTLSLPSVGGCTTRGGKEGLMCRCRWREMWRWLLSSQASDHF